MIDDTLELLLLGILLNICLISFLWLLAGDGLVFVASIISTINIQHFHKCRLFSIDSGQVTADVSTPPTAPREM